MYLTKDGYIEIDHTFYAPTTIKLYKSNNEVVEYKNNYNQFHPNLFVNEFPIAYMYDGKSYQEFISKKEFDLCKNLDDLIKIMNQKLY